MKITKYCYLCISRVSNSKLEHNIYTASEGRKGRNWDAPSKKIYKSININKEM